MKYLLLMFVPLFIMAQNIESLYEEVPQSNIYKSQKMAKEALLQKDKSNLYGANWNIGGGLGYASLQDNSDSGIEFSLSLGKKINLNSSKVDTLIEHKVLLNEEKMKIVENRLKVKIWQLYGNYCITMQALQGKAELASIHDSILEHIHKGVIYGELDSSKEIMASLTLDNLNLQISKLENTLQEYEAQIKVLVVFDGQFECKVVRPDFEKLFTPSYSAFAPMLEMKLKKETSSLELAREKVNILNVNGVYSQEIDTDRYMVVLSLPLNNSDTNEARKASAMSTIASVNYEMKAFHAHYKSETEALKNRLAIYTKYLMSTEDIIKQKADALIVQSNMRFLAGEESFISMLKATETKLQMIESILELKIDRHNAVAQYIYDYAINPQEITQ